MLARLALLAALFFPAVAEAQPETDPRVLFARGQASFDRGLYDEALVDFAAAYAMSPLPGFLFNIAQCHRRLGHFREAADHYERYLHEVPDAPNRADAEALLDEVRAELRETSPPPPAPDPTPVPPSVAPEPEVPAAPPPVRRRPRAASFHRPAAWVSLGLGVALGIGTTLFALRVQDRQDAFDDPGLDCNAERSRCLSLRADGRSAALWTNVLGGSALVFLAVGVVLHLLAPSADEPLAPTLARF